jgi:nucleotide-binding universal stress UspA family protein
MKRILVPVDGSDISLRGLKLAAQRAREANAEVHVLHVEPPMHYEELRTYALRPDLEELRGRACRRILDAAAALMAAEKLQHVEHLQNGEVAHTIARYAESHKVDEIIMGTRGLGALGSMMLGSTALRVVHLVHVPVTLVK